jgi:hypothetical protein
MSENKRCYYKWQVAKMYDDISVNTLMAWLEPFEGGLKKLGYKKKQKKFTIAQFKYVQQVLGEC